MFKTLRRLDSTYINPVRTLSDRWAAPVVDLMIRLFMADIFFGSGWLKFKNFLNGDWAATVYLFQDIHPLPGVPAGLAAVAGTGGELVLPVLLALGLFGRLGAAGLIAMTAVIQFVVPASYGVANPDHYMWMLLLGVIVVRGSGRLSADCLIRRSLSSGASAARSVP